MNKRFLHILIISLVAIIALPYTIRALFIDRFTVKGESMHPYLKDGEIIYVNKTIFGARIYKSFDFSNRKLNCFRLYGHSSIRLGDVVVFNEPDPYMTGQIEFRINRVYAKRCIACPGDTLLITNGHFLNGGKFVGSLPQQRFLANACDSSLLQKGVVMSIFPYIERWTIKDSGPFYIPRKGDVIKIDNINSKLYSRAIEYETGIPQEKICDHFENYTFTHDYYYFVGDNVMDSMDSRYFGVVPDDFIIGVVKKQRRFSQKYRDDIKTTLRLSGANRSELEYVLDYYENTNPKRKAAEFLIGGMKRHYSQNPDTGNKTYDYEVITAEYLLDNIDDAFSQYERWKWNKNIPLEDFYELILPYRIEHEPITEWRKKYRNMYKHVLDTMSSYTDIIDVVNTLNYELNKRPFIINNYKSNLISTPETLLVNRTGDCKDLCNFMLYLMRSFGIPATTDEYKVGNRHSWNMIRDTTGRYEIFINSYFNGLGAIRGGLDGRTKGMVIRNVWYDIPYKDVTEEYFGKCLIHSNSPYLGIYTKLGITPLSKGSLRVFGYRFDKLEQGKIYFPIKYRNNRIICTDYPFILSNSGYYKHILKPNYKHKQDIIVTRKVRMYSRLYSRMNHNKGAVFEASNYPDFRTIDTLGTFKEVEKNYNYIYLPDIKPYRYFRICAKPEKGLRLAEIKLFSDHNRATRIPIKVLASSQKYGGEPQFLLDNDELTFFESKDSNSFIVFDAGKQVRPYMLEWVPINDDNFIRYGDKYELFYHDGKNGWKSAGNKMADNTYLEFYDIPSNALYLLKNLTRGVEEEVFIMQYDHQLFL